eukprot:TRINITY_DN14158_c0_g3_i2.p1 TRINITY_DN14158_c0_g3~~TRINITY_DN14158_c0_g3_i2.p1  ORF type:complete len:340 (-),score=32.70 TRINITY_DN14158_c0_g3_i2:272-1291(-)
MLSHSHHKRDDDLRSPQPNFSLFSRKYIRVGCVIVLILALLSYFYLVPKSGRAQDRYCEAAKRLSICSHRANSTEFQGVFPGSMEAMRVLWKAGIRCFDMDVIQTSDRALLASHPDAIETFIGRDKFNRTEPLQSFVAEISKDQLRSLGASNDNFPTLEAVMALFSQLYHNEENQQGWNELGVRSPMFCLELKGNAINQDAVQYVAFLTKSMKLEGQVVMWMSASKESYIMMDKVQSQVDIKFAAIMQDRRTDENGSFIPFEPELTSEILTNFQIFGPSIKLSSSWYERALQSQRPLFSWVIDDEKSMTKALQVGASVAISNFPRQQQLTLDRLKDEYC